jgi:CubicO group peptidase (beta-lactamase class C family)
MPAMKWAPGIAICALGALACTASDPPARASSPDSGPGPATADGAPEPAPVLYPDPEWATGDPIDHGLDPAALADAANYADSIGSRCLLVIRDGRLVYERYFHDSSAGELQRTWSIDAIAHEHESPPGTVWKYTNRGVQVFDAVLEAATGMDPEDYAERHLWGPIGMNLEGERARRTHWDRDDAGNATTRISHSRAS